MNIRLKSEFQESRDFINPMNLEKSKILEVDDNEEWIYYKKSSLEKLEK